MSPRKAKPHEAISPRMEGIPWRQSHPRQRHTAHLHQSPLRHILRRRASPCRCRPWRKTPITQSVAALRALSRGCGLGGAGREVRRPWLKRTANLHHVSHKGTLRRGPVRTRQGSSRRADRGWPILWRRLYEWPSITHRYDDDNGAVPYHCDKKIYYACGD